MTNSQLHAFILDNIIKWTMESRDMFGEFGLGIRFGSWRKLVKDSKSLLIWSNKFFKNTSLFTVAFRCFETLIYSGKRYWL